MSENVDTQISSSVDISQDGKSRSRKNLIPFAKGDGRVRGRKAKGTASFPQAVDRIIDRRGAEAIAETLVDIALAGSVPAHRTLLELGGALRNVPVQVAVQQNNSIITPEALKAMEQFLREKGITNI